jgi:hypothetical protein
MIEMLIQATQQTQQGAQATTQRPPTSQELQDAARELRQAFRTNAVQQQVQAATERAAAAAARAQAATEPALPAPPALPGGIVIRRGDGGGTTIQWPPGMGGNANRIPPEAVDISIAFFITCAVIIIGWPLARAFARRMDRRSSGDVPKDITNQLAQLNQAVDAIAVEVERISEGQRFTSRLLSEQRGQAIPSSTAR